MRTIWIVILAFITIGVLQGAISLLPPSVAYRLSDTCGWTPRPWARLLGADATPLRADPLAIWKCRHQRGLKSRTPVLNHVMEKWPSKAELAAWEKADGRETTLPRELPAVPRAPGA